MRYNRVTAYIVHLLTGTIQMKHMCTWKPYHLRGHDEIQPEVIHIPNIELSFLKNDCAMGRGGVNNNNNNTHTSAMMTGK